MTTTCTTCGAELAPDATTCAVCGEVVTATPEGATPPPPAAGYAPSGYAAAAYTPAPHPSGLPADVRNWGMGAHLSAFAGAFFALAFVGPLVVWLIKRDEHPFIEHHAKEALNFNLSVLLYGIASVVLAFIVIGFITGLATLLAWVIFTVIGATKASNGEGYRYPLTIRFIS